MVKVIIFGTFDILHPGHKNLFKQAKKHGNYLIVVIARDKTVKEIKGKSPRHNEKIRSAVIKKDKLADKVILGSLSDRYASIKKHKPHIIALGYDQKISIEKLKNELNKLRLEKTKVIRLRPFHPEKYKSSKLKIV